MATVLSKVAPPAACIIINIELTAHVASFRETGDLVSFKWPNFCSDAGAVRYAGQNIRVLRKESDFGDCKTETVG